MNGFVLLAYNNSKKNMIASDDLENDLERKRLHFFKCEIESNTYDNVINYQILKGNDHVEKNISSTLIAGDIYGLFFDDNQKLLNYQESLEIIEKSNIKNEYAALEGNVCVCRTFEDKIVFQTDIEGYRKIYYYYEDKILCISTYLPLILKSIKKNWKLRKNAVISFLCSRESKWPLTFIEGIFSLPPLSRAEVTATAIDITSKTFSEFYQLKKITKENLREQLYTQYKLIIKRKVGENIAITLSGGYDSNCLTKLYSDTFRNNFTAVSVGYESNRERDNNIYNETIYAEKVSQKLNIPFKKYIFNQTDFFDVFSNFIDTIDQPGLDPSSNFIMNNYLNQDGFDVVVNGMGGDASYTPKRDLLYGIYSFQIMRLLNKINFDNKVAAFINYRGPMRFYKKSINLPIHTNFHDLFERTQLFSSPVCNYMNNNTLKDVDLERNLRIDYFNKLYKDANSKQEIYYSLAVFSSPDEYHALSMAERNDVEILMPFVNTKVALMLMNGAHFNSVNNRDFEMSIFGGIDIELLAKKKSGFSIPYSEWMPPMADSVFEFYRDIKYFSIIDFDLNTFQNRYKNNEEFAKSNFANMVIYKLLVVKEFINNYELNFG